MDHLWRRTIPKVQRDRQSATRQTKCNETDKVQRDRIFCTRKIINAGCESVIENGDKKPS